MKKDRSNIIVYIIVILIVIFGVFIILELKVWDKENLPVSENFTVYNGYRIYENLIGNITFYLVEAFDSNRYKYLYNFRYFPTEVKNIPVEGNVYDTILYVDENKDKYKTKIYISVDPSMTGQEALSIFGLAQILWIGTEGHEGIYKIPTQTAFSGDYEGEDHPIKTCEDATPNIGVVLLKYGDMRVYTEGYCVILQGNNLEELRMVNERLGYILLGVY